MSATSPSDAAPPAGGPPPGGAAPAAPAAAGKPAAPQAPSPAEVEAKRRKRRARLLIFGALIVIVGLIAFLWWFLHGRFYEETDDAYVAGDLVAVSAEVAGSVVALHVDDTQHVERGQLLIELDPADANVAMASAEAELARSVRQVRGLFSQADGLNAQIREREIALAAAKADLKRRQQVLAEGGVSAEEVQHAKDAVTQLSASLDVTRESLHTTKVQIDDTQVSTHPQVLAAAARVREAALALRRTKIVAPVAGTVARRGVQIGQRIAPGAPLLAVVPLDQAWVDANFKEVQLTRMRVNQPVRVHSDLYGSGVDYHGRIAGLGAGSGSAFALLPAQNASGNWIKVVQRVPVRVTLDPQELASHPLRIGLSMTAEVDLHDTSGALVATQQDARPARTVTTEDRDTAVDAHIHQIILDNLGPSAARGGSGAEPPKS